MPSIAVVDAFPALSGWYARASLRYDARIVAGSHTTLPQLLRRRARPHGRRTRSPSRSSSAKWLVAPVLFVVLHAVSRHRLLEAKVAQQRGLLVYEKLQLLPRVA